MSIMKCAVCGKEFGYGTNCQNCGVDRVTGLGNYNGYSSPSNGGKNQGAVGEPKTTNMVCYSCGEIIPSDSKFCPFCSKELYVICPQCGHKYSSQFPACNQCGTNRVKYFEREKERLRKEEEFKEYLDNLSAIAREIKERK